MAVAAGHYGPRESKPKLTPRQLEVTRLAACGLTNMEIALELGIRLNTVKNHFSDIFRRTGLVGKRLHLVLWALKEGLIDLEDVDVERWGAG